MKVAYLDCFAGVAGDMLVGALLDAGLPLTDLQTELDKLNITGWQIDVKRVKKQGVTGTKFNVVLEEHHDHRNLNDIRQIINTSTLATPIKDTALKIFERLALAEAKVHDTTVNDVHFHEVGALDAIIDIVGVAVGFHWLEVEEIICSPLITGRGYVHCAHGTIPVPAPATVELLCGIPYQQGNIEQELVTPTGAAVVATLCKEFRPLPEMITQQVGYGAGQRDLTIPNLLRLHIGKKKQMLHQPV